MSTASSLSSVRGSDRGKHIIGCYSQIVVMTIIAVLQSKPNSIGALGDKRSRRNIPGQELLHSIFYVIYYQTPLSQDDLLNPNCCRLKPAQIPYEKYVFLLFAIY